MFTFSMSALYHTVTLLPHHHTFTSTNKSQCGWQRRRRRTPVFSYNIVSSFSGNISHKFKENTATSFFTPPISSTSNTGPISRTLIFAFTRFSSRSLVSGLVVTTLRMVVTTSCLDLLLRRILLSLCLICQRCNDPPLLVAGAQWLPSVLPVETYPQVLGSNAWEGVPAGE